MGSSKVTWKDGMAFDAELDGHHFTIDATEKVGGRDLGPRPKGLTVVSLIGCTAMDVISILNKMQQTVKSFDVSGDPVMTDEHPVSFKKIHVVYRAEGEIEEAKIKRAVQLSEERYCGVSATLRASVELSSEIWLNGKQITE